MARGLQVAGWAMISLALAAGPAAAADEAAQGRDLRCVIVGGMIVSKTTDEATRLGVTAAVGYFVGRLKGRDPGMNLTARLSNELKTLRLGELGGETTRCSAEILEFGREMQTAGAAMKAIGEGPPGAPT
jgi:hypothetical protein